MKNETVQAYIQQRLDELTKEKDMKEVVARGKLSFGIDTKDFSHLPSWQNFRKKKKQMVKLVWLNAFFLSLMVVAIISDVWDKFESNWMKALAAWILLSAFIMLFYVISSHYSLFYHFRQTERELRKLIYEDVLQKLKDGKTG